MATSSILFVFSAPLIKSHAARSARVLLLAYALMLFSTFDQSFSSKVLFSRLCPAEIAAVDETCTTRLTFALCAARRTRKVPCTAGTISSSSFFGSNNGKGEATCRTYSTSFIASFHPESRSKSTGITSSQSFARTYFEIVSRTSVSRERVRNVPRIL